MQTFSSILRRGIAPMALLVWTSSGGFAQVGCTNVGTAPVLPTAHVIGTLPCVSATITIRGLTVTPNNFQCPTAIEVVPLHWEQATKQDYYVSGYQRIDKQIYVYECRQHSFLIFTTGVSCAMVQGPVPSGFVRSFFEERCTGAPPVPEVGLPVTN